MESKITSYRDLVVWQKSMMLATEIYRVTSKFPAEEKFDLVSQMRRCAVSIPSNIAEGSCRSSRKDYRSFVLIAFGSGAELETQIQIVKNLALTPDKELSQAITLLKEIMPMLNGLSGSLES